MSTLQSTSHASAPALPDAAEITLASWLAEHPPLPPPAALQLITRIAKTLGDARVQGVRHGGLTPVQVVLSGSTAAAFGDPELRGSAPSAGARPRREDVAADVASLAGIAQAVLVPAPSPGRGRHRPALPPARARATAAVIAAGMDRREGVFVFESPLDFVVALETAIAADAETPPAPDPALLASRRRRRRRRRVMKVVAGAVVAFASLLVVSNATAAPRPTAAGPAITRAL